MRCDYKMSYAIAVFLHHFPNRDPFVVFFPSSPPPFPDFIAGFREVGGPSFVWRDFLICSRKLSAIWPRGKKQRRKRNTIAVLQKRQTCHGGSRLIIDGYVVMAFWLNVACFHWTRWLVLRRAHCELGTIAVFYKQIRDASVRPRTRV